MISFEDCEGQYELFFIEQQDFVKLTRLPCVNISHPVLIHSLRVKSQPEKLPCEIYACRHGDQNNCQVISHIIKCSSFFSMPLQSWNIFIYQNRKAVSPRVVQDITINSSYVSLNPPFATWSFSTPVSIFGFSLTISLTICLPESAHLCECNLVCYCSLRIQEQAKLRSPLRIRMFPN